MILYIYSMVQCGFVVVVNTTLNSMIIYCHRPPSVGGELKANNDDGAVSVDDGVDLTGLVYLCDKRPGRDERRSTYIYFCAIGVSMMTLHNRS